MRTVVTVVDHLHVRKTVPMGNNKVAYHFSDKSNEGSWVLYAKKEASVTVKEEELWQISSRC